MYARTPTRSPRPFSQLADDRTAIGLRVAHLLNTVSIDATWIPPSSVLIIRRFTDPLPRQLCEQEGALVASRDWELAAQSALREQFRRAVRPRQGVVPAGTTAVLFETPAELMACLAHDLRCGDAFAHWWWRSHLRGAGATPGATLTNTLCREPRSVPAAMETLAAWGEAERVVSQLSAQQARLILETVLRSFGLPWLAAEVGAATTAPSQNEHAQDADAPSPQSPSTTFAADSPGEPWEPQVSATLTPPRLGSHRRALLGITLLLARAPHCVRTSRFERKFRRWLMETAHADVWLGTQASPRSDGAEGIDPVALRPAASIDNEPPLDVQQDPTPPAVAAARIPIQIPDRQPLRAMGSTLTSKPDSETDADELDSSSSPDFDLQSGVATQLGGVAFLIPFFRSLDFFSRIEQDFHLESPPSPWALVELFARCMLGRLTPELRSDPIWLALRSLDRRSAADDPGKGFVGAPEYCLPHEWLMKLGAEHTGLLSFSRRASRLIVRHPRGFPMLDSLLTDGEADRSPHELLGKLPGTWNFARPTRQARRRISILSSASPECGNNSELARFLHFLHPFFRWALARMLSSGFSDRRDPVVELLRRRGTLYVSSTHVDLVMDLNSVSLSARLAGLDANPGWVPELGRVITYHYR